jgi:hypothetical protein
LKYDDEINVATTLSQMGKDVKTVKRTSTNTYDFLVDGVAVELKTAYPQNGSINNKTATQAIAKGINEQGAEEVIQDLRYGVTEKFDVLDIFDLYYFTATKLKRAGTFQLKVWSDDGIYSGEVINTSLGTEA